MSDEDALGGASFGLSRVLADSGIDPSTFSSFFSKTGGGPSHTAFDEVDAASDEDAKYEDDVSDSDLPKESEEETRMRATRKAEEERWVRRAAELQRSLHSEKEGAERDRKRRKKALDAEARIKLVWPDYEPGKRLRMSEIFYETPLQSRQWQKGLNRAKRKTRDKVERESDRGDGETFVLIWVCRSVRCGHSTWIVRTISFSPADSERSCRRGQEQEQIRCPHWCFFRPGMGPGWQSSTVEGSDQTAKRIEAR